MVNQIEKLVLNGGGQKFKARDFRDLLLPGVYCFMRDCNPVYIGSAKCLLNSISRDPTKQYKRRRALETSQYVLLWPCVSEGAARQLEKMLIRKCKPEANIVGKK